MVRILQIILVGAIVGNPMLCRMKCCGTERSVCDDAVVSSEKTPSGCQACDGCDRTHEAAPVPSKAPCDCPGDSLCQCFSAGAIVQERASGDIPRSELAVGGVAVLLSVCPANDDSTPERFDRRLPRGRANPGRMLRCWVSSFLC